MPCKALPSNPDEIAHKNLIRVQGWNSGTPIGVGTPFEGGNPFGSGTPFGGWAPFGGSGQPLAEIVVPPIGFDSFVVVLGGVVIFFGSLMVVEVAYPHSNTISRRAAAASAPIRRTLANAECVRHWHPVPI